MTKFDREYWLQSAEESYQTHLHLTSNQYDEAQQILHCRDYLARQCERMCDELAEVKERNKNSVFVISSWGAMGEQVTVVVEPTHKEVLNHLHESYLNKDKTRLIDADTKIIKVDLGKQGIAFDGGGSMG